MKVLGIDPGLKGAIARWNGCHLDLLVIPIVKSSGRGNEVCWSLLNSQWDSLFPIIDHVFLELVHAQPKDGGSSAFKFGTVYGGLMAMTAAKRIPITLVTPGKWKKAYSLIPQKEAAVRRASQLFPLNANSFYGPRGGLKDGLAEAALIAKYGYDQLGG